jgi:hypothetical protein
LVLFRNKIMKRHKSARVEMPLVLHIQKWAFLWRNDHLASKRSKQF